MSYITKNRRSRKLGKITEDTLIIKNENNKDLKTADIVNIYKKLEEQRRGKKAEYVVRALAKDGMKSFKGFKDKELNIQDALEYYEGNIKDPNKFDAFEYVEITIKKY